ncbi:M15 family metallopeptidase [Corallococcus coralloides]|uniref:M15 family metallopeptidase n=1 Tax=Corallococcus coralloides TaxID=184914 RepID=UPI00384C9A8F
MIPNPELFSRLDLKSLYPPFQAVMGEVIARCRARGADYVATRGYATFAEQRALHLRYLKGEGGRAAPEGLSAHNYGLANDFCRDADVDRPGLQPRWDGPAYAILGEETRRAGLAWGGSFGDAPHCQWPSLVSGSQLEPVRGLFHSEPKGSTDAQRLAAVWRFLDTVRSMPEWRAMHPTLAASLARLGF